MSFLKSWCLVWFYWCVTGGVVYCCHLPWFPGEWVQGESRDTGLLRHTFHHLCLYLRGRADVPTATRDRRRAGRAPDIESLDHHAVRQPVAPVHPLLITGGLLSHPGLLRYSEMMTGRIKANMKEETKQKWRDGCIRKLRLSRWSITPCLYNRVNDWWMDGCRDGGMVDAVKNQIK